FRPRSPPAARWPTSANASARRRRRTTRPARWSTSTSRGTAIGRCRRRTWSTASAWPTRRRRRSCCSTRSSTGVASRCWTPPAANLDTTVVRLGAQMDALTIHEAAQTTGWSPRMLRYVERIGLVEPGRSEAAYRLYGPAELQRLRTLRELQERFDVGLGEIGLA